MCSVGEAPGMSLGTTDISNNNSNCFRLTFNVQENCTGICLCSVLLMDARALIVAKVFWVHC